MDRVPPIDSVEHVGELRRELLLNPKGNKVRLTEKETSILRYLYRAGQRPVSRQSSSGCATGTG